MKISNHSVSLKEDMEYVTELDKIIVTYALTAPIFFWEQVGAVNRESEEDSLYIVEILGKSLEKQDLKIHKNIVEVLSKKITNYKNLVDSGVKTKNLTSNFDSIINNVPIGLELSGTVDVSYEDLREMFKKNKYSHQIEWRDIINWIDDLPVSHLITG